MTKIEEQMLKNIQNGSSINSQAKKYSISWDTVKAICVKHSVSSQHTNVKATEDDIINMLSDFKVSTVKEISEYFKLSKSNYQRLRERLQSMVRRNKIKRVKLSTIGRLNRNGIFKGYLETYLFYISDKALREWVITQIPTGLPLHLRKVISRTLHSSNINIDLTNITSTKTVVFTETEYKKLKMEAKKKEMGIKEMLLHGGK